MEVIIILLAVSLILFFGYFAEFVFKRFSVPDVLFLILLGFVIGPHLLNFITPQDVAALAPIFTTFTLLFLLFDGAFNIDLSAFARGLSFSIGLTLFNFIVSSVAVTIIMMILGFSLLSSIMTAFILGGVSSAFVIPLLKQIQIGPRTNSVLTLESALTDVLCIVSALTVISLINLNIFNARTVFSDIVSLFAVAGLMGILGGIVWTIVETHMLKEHKSYMVTIAFLILIYVLTELLGGNGAIAALFFGLFLKNAKLITSIFKGIVTREAKEKQKAMQGELGVSILTPSEKFFYDQVSFLLKTFFFVYVGILIDISDMRSIIIGLIIALTLMLVRNTANFITKSFAGIDRSLINSVFGRGLSAAVIAQIAIASSIPEADFIAKIVYIALTGTILFSSMRVFVLEWKHGAKKAAAS